MIAPMSPFLKRTRSTIVRDVVSLTILFLVPELHIPPPRSLGTVTSSRSPTGSKMRGLGTAFHGAVVRDRCDSTSVIPIDEGRRGSVPPRPLQ